MLPDIKKDLNGVIRVSQKYIVFLWQVYPAYDLAGGQGAWKPVIYVTKKNHSGLFFTLWPVNITINIVFLSWKCSFSV